MDSSRSSQRGQMSREELDFRDNLLLMMDDQERNRFQLQEPLMTERSGSIGR